MEELLCPICLHFEPEVQGDYFTATPCGHIFHYRCILDYLVNGKQRCPTCDKPMNPRRLTKLYGIDTSSKLNYSNASKRTAPSSLLSSITKEPVTNKEAFNYMFKVALLGSSGVGKSCMLKRFSEGRFVPNLNATRGVDLVRKKIIMGDLSINLIIWDTIGQEVFNSITSTCVRDVQGILFVYDITKAQTLKDLQYWINFAEDYAPKETVKILVGNQIDQDEKRQVSFREGKAVADKYNFQFFETTAKLSDSDSVEATFRALTAKILENEWILSAVRNRMNDNTIRIKPNDSTDSSCLGIFRRGWHNFISLF